MTDITVNPFILRDTAFKVASDDYKAHLSAVEFVPTSQVVTWKGLTPAAVFSFGTAATWAARLTYAQDWSTEDSLSRYLYEHEGDEIEVEFEPIAGGPSITATIIIAPGSIGGTIDQVATATVTLGVKGRPELGDAPEPEAP